MSSFCNISYLIISGGLFPLHLAPCFLQTDSVRFFYIFCNLSAILTAPKEHNQGMKINKLFSRVITFTASEGIWEYKVKNASAESESKVLKVLVEGYEHLCIRSCRSYLIFLFSSIHRRYLVVLGGVGCYVFPTTPLTYHTIISSVTNKYMDNFWFVNETIQKNAFFFFFFI